MAQKKKTSRKRVAAKKTVKKKTAKPKRVVKKTAKKKAAKRAVAKKAPAKKKAPKKRPAPKRPAAAKPARAKAPARPKPSSRRGKSYLSAEHKKQLRQKLQEQKRHLLEEISKTVGYMQLEANQFADPGDRATHEEERNLELKERDRERKLIRKIDNALARIGRADYGYCTVCDAEIGLKRMKARPTATLCVDCKTLEELKERQIGGL